MNDKVDIGLTGEGRENLQRVTDTGWFADDQDAGRFCLAYAVRQGVAHGEVGGARTKWSSGNFDPSGEIRSLIRAFYPETTTPVRLMEHLVNEGLLLVRTRIDTGVDGPETLLDTASSSSSPGTTGS